MVDQTPETTYCDHGRPQGYAKRAFAPPSWKLRLRRKNFWKT